MALETITPPAAEPVALSELKEFMRVDSGDTSQDALITTLGIAARSWAEVYTRRRFITQTVRLMVDCFPGYIDTKLTGANFSSPFVSGSNALLVGIRYALILPYPPVQSIAAFTYLNANGTSTAMTAGTDYVADLDSQPARLTPPFSAMWPVARVVLNAVKVDFVCGYGDDGAEVPELIKAAIKLLATYWFENRIADQNDVPASVKALLSPFRNLRF